MASVVYTTAVFVLCFGAGQAFPWGAPSRACVHMTPGHGVESTSVNPYRVTASASYYTPGVPLTVTISGSSFQGLLLQARMMGSTTALGTFSNFPVNTKGSTCTTPNSAATHSSTALKLSPTTFTWTPPPGLTGLIEFVGTVAAEKTIWWRNTKSAPLSLVSTTPSPSPPTPPPVSGLVCPYLSPGAVGPCVELCSYDYQCASGQKCCSNGCGHSCMTAVPGCVDTCPSCPYQQVPVRDSYGCWTSTCACYNPCAIMTCATGYTCTVEQVQCVTTPCDPVASCKPRGYVCPAIACPACPYGQIPQRDQYGCDTCYCYNPCATQYCPYGQYCLLQQVQCFTTPCDPVPVCRYGSDGSRPTSIVSLLVTCLALGIL